MEQTKIDNFCRDHEGSFPPFRTISPSECRDIREKIASKLDIPKDANVEELARRVDELIGKPIGPPAVNAEFNLVRALMKAGAVASDTVFLNWHRYDDIDQMKIADLSRYFDDIWYPSSDDLDIFDESLQWILTIHHDGEVKYATFPPPRALKRVLKAKVEGRHG